MPRTAEVRVEILLHEWGAPMSAVSRAASTAAAAFGRMAGVAACLALLLSIPVVSRAQDGRLFVECVDDAQPQDTLSIVVDFDRQAVAGAFPINWAWFTEAFVLFQYSTLINGHQHTMQSYTLDRATQTLEICDFAAGQEYACRHRSCAVGRWDEKATPLSAVRAHQVTTSP
jgi:hypothetical protein